MRVLTSAQLRRLPGQLELAREDLIVQADNAVVLPRLPDARFDLVYIDPPFNTGRRQTRHTLEVAADPAGDRSGFGDRRYRSRLLRALAYDDSCSDYLGFLTPRLAHAHRLLADHGTLYFHIDYREAHYCKLLLDELFGRECFLNEIIWAYDYGGRPRRRWPAKHDTILVYVKDRRRYHFDSAEVEREPYMAPGLVGPEKAARGKLPSSVWWHTIVPTTGREKTGYPSQKPEGVVRRAVAASSRPGGWCLDFFAGSGTLGAVCRTLGRRFVLVDDNPEAIEVMLGRLGGSEEDGRTAVGSA
jgi:site-specific DNA-methyltransferase (adenine-specific)